jgi:hypothetical protein
LAILQFQCLALSSVTYYLPATGGIRGAVCYFSEIIGESPMTARDFSSVVELSAPTNTALAAVGLWQSTGAC